MITALTTRVVTFVQHHLYLLAHLYDPILDQEPASGPFRECSRQFSTGKLSNIRRHFLLPAVCILFASTFGIIGLELDARGMAVLQKQQQQDLNSVAHALAHSPHILGHQVAPRAMWSTLDLIVMTISAVESILYLFLAYNPLIGDRFRMYTHGNGKDVWHGSQSM